MGEEDQFFILTFLHSMISLCYCWCVKCFSSTSANIEERREEVYQVSEPITQHTL